MLEKGFIKIDRKLTKWRWYQDANTFRVFFHLLLTANYENRDFENITVQRGQRVTSRAALARELGISEQSIRTALKHLEATGEITSSRTAKFTVITINCYDKYQSVTNTSTSNQPAANQQLTSDQPQCKKDKESLRKKKNVLQQKHKYGEYQNVLLSDTDMQKLQTEFPSDYLQRIERLSEYMASTGKTYKNHLATIRNWARKETQGTSQGNLSQKCPERTEQEKEIIGGLLEAW